MQKTSRHPRHFREPTNVHKTKKGMHKMSEAYVVDKNLGQPLLLEEGDLPQKNSAGEPVVELTDEQKYLFDVRGWLLVPGVLADDEIEAMREYALRVQQHPESLPEHERSFVAGPLEKLTDHPVVVGFLNEFLAFPGLSSAECYGFRMEGSGLRNPAATPRAGGRFQPAQRQRLLSLCRGFAPLPEYSRQVL